MYVFTQISTYREYTHTLTDLYTRICTYPDSACSRHINRFGGGKKKKKISVTVVLTFLQSTVLKVTDAGLQYVQSKCQLLQCA